jgi:methylmalonyl-CoA mutase, N-terminal domain
MIGVNKYNIEDEVIDIPIVEIDDAVEEGQLKRLAEVKRKRDNRQVAVCLKDLADACRKGENVMPFCIAAVKEYASVQEICDVYREVYGEYRDPGIY